MNHPQKRSMSYLARRVAHTVRPEPTAGGRLRSLRAARGRLQRVGRARARACGRPSRGRVVPHQPDRRRGRDRRRPPQHPGHRRRHLRDHRRLDRHARAGLPIRPNQRLQQAHFAAQSGVRSVGSNTPTPGLPQAARRASSRRGRTGARPDPGTPGTWCPAGARPWWRRGRARQPRPRRCRRP